MIQNYVLNIWPEIQQTFGLNATVKVDMDVNITNYQMTTIETDLKVKAGALNFTFGIVVGNETLNDTNIMNGTFNVYG